MGDRRFVSPLPAFPGGVERFSIQNQAGDYDEGEQCARCGSSVGWEWCEVCNGCDDYQGTCSTCSGRGGWSVCLSRAEWCRAHPMKGREQVKGAGDA